jgi:hypothetical protein
MSRNLISYEQTLSHHIPDRTPGLFALHIDLPEFPGLLKKKMTIENENKDDCIQSIAFGLNRTALWRDKIFDRYGDQRNVWASKALKKLAGDTPGLSEESWAQLQPHYDWGSERWREAISQAARQVGFTTVTVPGSLLSQYKLLCAVIDAPWATSLDHKITRHIIERYYAKFGNARASLRYLQVATGATQPILACHCERSSTTELSASFVKASGPGRPSMT